VGVVVALVEEGGRVALLFMSSLSHDTDSHDTESLHEVFHDISHTKNKKTKERDKYLCARNYCTFVHS